MHIAQEAVGFPAMTAETRTQHSYGFNMTTDTLPAYPSTVSDLRGVPFLQGYLDAEGIRIRYISSGSPDKPLLLALHGVGGHAEAYSRNLRAHGEHFWMVANDLLGHGWTDKPPTHIN
jgi:2-hydroxy-6-oxonona-2,4-dienedioate hydrolase